MKIRIWIGIGSLSGGGAETQVNLLANGLPKDRFEVRIGYVSKSQYDPPASSDFTRKYFGRKYRYDWLSVWFGVARDIRKFEPDIVHLWLPDVITIPGVILSRLHGIPVITSIRRSTFKGIPLSQYCREFLGLFPHSISKCIVTNFDIKEEPFWVRKLCSLRNHKVIPNGVDIYRQGSEYVSKSHNVFNKAYLCWKVCYKSTCLSCLRLCGRFGIEVNARLLYRYLVEELKLKRKKCMT